MNKLDIYKDNQGEWRWRIKARNGRIIGASSEGFKRRQKAIDNMGHVFRALRTWGFDEIKRQVVNKVLLAHGIRTKA